MKFPVKLLPLLLLAMLPRNAWCQVSVSVNLPYSSYVRFEAVKAAVRIRNDTDAMLIVGGIGEGVTLELDVRAKNQDKKQRRKSAGLLVSNVIVLPGETKEVTIDVAAHYDLQNTGQYNIKADIITAAASYQSAGQVIDVVPGIELQSVERAAPGQPGSMRVYKLLYIGRSDTEHLFLAVTDKEQRTVFGVFDLGPVMRFLPPTLSVDVSGEIIVKHQPDYEVTILTRLQSTYGQVIFLSQERQPQPGSSD